MFMEKRPTKFFLKTEAFRNFSTHKRAGLSCNRCVGYSRQARNEVESPLCSCVRYFVCLGEMSSFQITRPRLLRLDTQG